MKMRQVVGIVYVALAMAGCATSEVLSREVPDKYIEVIPEDPTTDVEASLKASGKDYVCKEFYFGQGSSKNRRACFIKAPEESIYKTLGVKLQEVPEALLVDTGKTMLVVGQVALEIVLQNVFPWYSPISQ